MRARFDIRRWGAALVAAAAALVFLPTVADVYLFDDAPVVRDNPLLGEGGLRDFFGGNLFGDPAGDRLFRPLLLVSLWIDRALFSSAAAMHATNLALHALAAALLFRVLQRFTDDKRALAAAMLFAVHPVHLDAVAFIVNRSEMLALIFCAAALLAFLYDKNWRAWLRGEPTTVEVTIAPIAIASLAFACALLSKEMAAGALPVLWVTIALRGRPPRAVWVGLAALTLVLVGYLAARQHALAGTVAGAGWIKDRRLAVLLPTVSRLFADYVRLVIAPYPLLVDRSNFVIGQPAFLSYLLHAAVLGVALWRRGAAAILILGFYAALLPVAHIIPIREIEAERFLYLPSALACGLLALLPPRRATALIISLYAVVGLAESTHFHSAEALWSTMVARDPSSPRARYNLGTARMEASHCDRALAEFEEAVRLLPGYAEAWSNLGRCRVAVGDHAGARVALQNAVALDDKNPRAHRNLAVFLALHGEREAARRELARARSLSPNDPENDRVANLIE